MFDTLIHRWLQVPYTLHVRTRQRIKGARATVLFIHGIGNSGAAWDEVIEKLGENCNIISIDLLGFGHSPKPTWATYSARTQARSVIATLMKLRLKGRVIIVGHSLGALVAVEVAKRYPLIVKSLVLCSPPFYSDKNTLRLIPRSDKILKDLYRLIQKRPEQFVRISAIAIKYNLVNKAYSVSRDDIHSYMGALEASIINQTSLEDAKKLKKPMQLIYGTLDPVVLKRNLKELIKANPCATLATIVAGHEVRGRYVPTAVEHINDAISNKTVK